MEAEALHDFQANAIDELPFKAGAILKVTDMNDPNWWQAELNGKEGLVPFNFLKLRPCPWYHGKISRVASESLLQRKGKPGSFLVRDSEAFLGDFSISVRSANAVQHFKIIRDREQGQYYVWTKKHRSINQIVAHHQSVSIAKDSELFLLEPLPNQTEAAAAAAPAANQRTATAEYDFDPLEEGELQFKKGDKITILDDSSPNWWRGALNGQEGIFPATYVKKDK
eukprot:Clim_evm80s152 gene=Clim_evmTU80s152